MVARSKLFALALTSATGLGAQACSPEGGLSGNGLDGPRDTTNSQAPGVGRDGALSGGGRYPLNAAPQVWAERQKLVASDGATGDFFGSPVSLSGDAALIGASGDDDKGSWAGSAYVFARSAATWTQQQKLLADDGATEDTLGGSVSLSGETALIGAPGDDDKGAAYVFTRSATTWAQQQKLLADDGAAYDNFGSSVSLSGDMALIAAERDDDKGAAYVFTRSATTWTQRQKLLADDGAAYDNFGSSVSLSSDMALIAAERDDDKGVDAGSAYVFTRSATTWVQTQKLLADDGAAYDYFGSHVSLSSDMALIGAERDDDKGPSAGAVYAFIRSAATWVQTQKLLADDGAQEASFGNSVSLSGNMALIGASRDDDKGNGAGAAYVFARSAATWTQEVKVLAGDGGKGDSFGLSVSLSGDMALIGAFGDSDKGVNAGSAYVFALRLVDGDPCASDEACASKFCADGICCASACAGACETCDVAGLEGVCTPSVRGSLPTASCDGYLCNGATGGCTGNCASDEDCSATYSCASALACVPKKADAALCNGNNVCLSGHCIDGVCCEGACDEGCGSCVSPGLEGACTPLERGNAGSPSCTPFLCDGRETGCPGACQAHGDCTPSAHCDGGRCQSDEEQGAACGEDDACTTGHCTDGLCCLVDACGAYRCGSGGICQTSCSSSAQCAEGQQCSSADKCEPMSKSADGASENGSCHLASVSGPAQQRLGWRWVGALALLACSGLARRRRRDRRPQLSAQTP